MSVKPKGLIDLDQFEENHDIKITKINKNDIAIIGIAQKLPNAENLDEFWRILKSGESCVRSLPINRAKDAEKYLYYKGTDIGDVNQVRAAFLKEIDKFDYSFFGISPKEAELMDPNQRLLLETAWSAIEDSGYGEEKIRGTKTGVYIGFSGESEYKQMITEIQPENLAIALNGNLAPVIASRISYLLDLKGPCMILNTLCSSSLVAVHLACQAIRNDDCKMAIVGGVKTYIIPNKSADVGIESSDGVTRTFDENSDGTGGGEGVIVMLLKPLSKAIEDNDNIHAVIKGSAINQDGKSMSMSAPNPAAQQEVIVEAWKRAGVDPETISYIEAHGTGTKLGDPIEIDGINRSFSKFTDKKQFCAVGSVKSNIGHLDSTAGLAGVLKAVLSLKHSLIPPTINFTQPNSKIQFHKSSVYVNDSLRRWGNSNKVKRCAVSSFGFSGTNCHVVLEEAPKKIEKDNKMNGDKLNILKISAKSANSAKKLAEEYSKFLKSHVDICLENFCYVANTGRGNYAFRTAIVGTNKFDFIKKLEKFSKTDSKVSNEDEIFVSSNFLVSTSRRIIKDNQVSQEEVLKLSENSKVKILQYIEKKKVDRSLLKEICEFYISGADIKWESMYKDKGYEKISIPTYTFEKKRCWINIPNVVDNNHSKNQKQFFHNIVWKNSEISEVQAENKLQKVVVFNDSRGKADKILNALREQGADVIEVVNGNEFSFANGVYTLRSLQQDYDNFFENIREENITSIIHMSSIRENNLLEDIDNLDKSQQAGVYSLFFIEKSMVKYDFSNIDVLIVSQYVNNVNKEQLKVYPENATLFGLGKTIKWENYNNTYKLLDIDDESDFTQVILKELKAGKESFNIAYRNNQRYIPELNEVNMSECADTDIKIRENGVYIITGGTGGLGLEVAKYLSSKNNVNLALINRSKLPEKDQWNNELKENSDKKLCKIITDVLKIEENGSCVSLFSADVSDDFAIKSIFSQLRSKYGEINGVIHAAGIGVGMQGVTVAKDKKEIFDLVCNPKVKGTYVLHNNTLNDQLDFFTVFTSPITLIGGKGSGSYSAANAYLDSFVEYRNKIGKRTIGMSWAPWIETIKSQNNEINNDEHMFEILSTNEIMNAFEVLLSKETFVTLAGKMNYKSSIFALGDALPFSISKNIANKITDKIDKNNNKSKYNLIDVNENVKIIGREDENYSEIEKKVARIMGRTLGYSQISIYDNFFELGGDSIIAVKVINNIKAEMNINVTITNLLENPNVEALSKNIEKLCNVIECQENYKCDEKNSDCYPVSSAQKRMYISYKLGENSTNYNMFGLLELNGVINKNKIEYAFQKLVERHEILRTYFEEADGEIQQKIHQQCNFKVSKYLNISENELGNKIEEFIKPFDLSEAPLLRCGVAEISESRCFLLIDMHHIISDGVSVSIIIEEFLKLYLDEELQSLDVQYRDYVSWQQEFTKTENFKKQQDYWLEKFSGELPILNIATDYPIPKVQSFEGDVVSFNISKQLMDSLKQRAVENHTTLYVILLTAYNILLHKYTGQTDIIIGSPFHGRPNEEFSNVLGMFANSLAMRNNPEDNKSVKTFIKEVKENVLRTFENADFQFEDLVDKTNAKRDLSRNPIFDTVFSLYNSPYTNLEFENFKVINHDYYRNDSKLFITLAATNNIDNMNFSFEYCTKLFKRETIERMKYHYLNILNEIINDSDQRLSEINMLSEEEIQLLERFNNTELDYAKEKTIHECFHDVAKTAAEDKALIFRDREFTYKEMDDKSNQLARILRKKGVKVDDIVAIMIEPSIDIMISIMAVLKAGGAYLPIDPAYPKERINYILEDSCAKYIITENKLLSEISPSREIICVDDKNIYNEDFTSLENVNKPEDLAYVIYTSGSTGKPKGVMVEHRNVMNFVKGMQDKIQFNNGKKILLLAAISFDMSGMETFVPLLSGMTIVVAEEKHQKNLRELKKIIRDSQIDMLQLTPSRLRLLIEHENDVYFLNNITELIVGAEEFPKEVLDMLLKEAVNTKIYNAYGPTETVTWSTIKRIEKDNEVNIGKPIANTKVYILDKNNKEQGIGIPGELYIAGDGVARGYLNREELTRERFLISPFNSSEIMFKTGDLVKRLPNGDIEFLGRIDNQVKIRGYRIELGEIENQLKAYKGIKDAVVIACEDENKYKNLNAYIVVDKEIYGENTPTISQLREYLLKTLPEYMIPSYFMYLDELPLTPNGKVDRILLSNLEGTTDEDMEYKAPTNEIEAELVEIWKNILSTDKLIGIHNNFFEIGGNSIKIMKMVAIIEKSFNVEIGFKEIFQLKTISAIAQYIKNNKEVSGRRKYPQRVTDIENINEPFPLTNIQNSYLLGRSGQYELGGVSTHIYNEFEIRIDMDRFNDSLNMVIKRHPMLRTIITEDGKQKILDRIPKYEIEVNDIQQFSKEEQMEVIIVERRDMSHQVFKSDEWPLFRVKAFRLKEDIYYMCIGMDLLIADATSLGIILNDINAFYENPEVQLPELKFNFRDYILAYKEMEKSDIYMKDKEYWVNKIVDFPLAPELPIKTKPSDVKDPHFKRKFKRFNKNELNKLKKFAADNELTMASILCTAYGEVLKYWSNQRNFVINLTVFNRYPFHEDVNKIVGDFTSVILIDCDLKEDNFTGRVKGVQEKIFDALEHRHYDGVEFLRELAKYNNIINQAITPVVFTHVEGNEEKAQSMNGIISSDERVTDEYLGTTQTSQVFLDNQVAQLEDELSIVWDYIDEIFHENMIDKMFNQYIEMLEKIIEGQPLCEFELLQEDKLLIEKYNMTEKEIPETTLIELFKEQVNKTRNNIAIEHKAERITYDELDKKSNQVARYLMEKDVKCNDIVGVIASRDINTIVNVLGIIKAGAAYVTIDKNYPDERKEYIVKNSNAKLLLTSEMYDEENQNKYSKESINIEISPDNLAYIIYTSGSTGEPKGVMITHGAVSNTIIDINERFDVNEKDKIIGISSMCFDLSVYDVFGALSSGATLVLVNDQRDAEELATTVFEHGITVWNTVPAIMNMTIEHIEENLQQYESYDDSKLRVVLLSGDWIPLKLPNDIRKYYKNAQVISLGGATEASIWSIYYPIDQVQEEWKSIPYGMPLYNQEFYVLNDENRLCPVGTSGELCIGGKGVALGYLNDIEKTEKSFIQHKQLGRLYKTGDYGVLTRKGYIEFLGRVDSQVKIQGHRVELGEIEAKLKENPIIKNVAVVDYTNKYGKKFLCAYIVSDDLMDTSELRAYLRDRLPYYMIPTYFEKIEEIPLSANGKVKKKKLPAPNKSSQVKYEYTAPTNEIEKGLVRIWSEILAIDEAQISVNSDFFEKGGDSLKATNLMTKIYQSFNVKISLKNIFNNTTIKSISKLINNSEKNIYSSIKPIEQKEYYPLTPAQKRMFVLQQMAPDSTSYNIPNAFLIEGKLNKEQLENSFKELINRHESLRTSFKIIEGEPVQQIHKYVEFEIEQIDANENEIKEKISRFIRPFDLRKGPLLRVGLVEITYKKFVCMYDIHHIVSDGISVQILIEELIKIYEGSYLPKIRLQYKDYSKWYNDLLNSELMKKQEMYWLDVFKDNISVLDMPLDYPRPAKQLFRGGSVQFKIGKELTGKLNAITKKTGSTMYMLLLATFNVLLSKYSGQEDIIIGTPSAGRPHTDLQKIIGMFVNTLAMRNYPKRDMTFKEFLSNVRDVSMTVFENQEYQFEQIVDKIGITKDMSRNLLFDVMFALQNVEVKDIEIKGLKIKPYHFENNIAKFDLTLIGVEIEEDIDFKLVYNTTLYKVETIKTMKNHFIDILKEISNDINIRIDEIELEHDFVFTKMNTQDDIEFCF